MSETFTAANGTDVDALTGWDEHPSYTAGQFLIQSNRAYAAVNDALVYNTGTPASADYAVEATIFCVSVSGKQGFCGRVDTAAATYYEVRYQPADPGWRLNRVVDNTPLLIDSYAQTLTPGNSYTVKLEMVGSAIKVYVDGTVRISVDDTTISAKGKAGLVAATSSGSGAGLHFDTLTATDASAPTSSGSYVGVGAAQTVANSGNIFPALPAGLAVDDLLVCVAWERSTSGSFTMNSSGWTQIASPSAAGKSRVWTRFYQAGDTAPSIAIISNNLGGIAQVAAFRGIDKTTSLDLIGSARSGVGTDANIGPLAGITPSVAKAVVVVIGGRQSSWTSVGTLSGDSLTWNEIAEATSASSPAIGLVWDYAVFSGAPSAVTDKTFTVTGGTGNWHGYMLAFRPATTAVGPKVSATKIRSGGAFSAAKLAKRRASGSFATKPVKVIGADKPPREPPPVGEGHQYTLPTVSVANQAQALTFTATPPTYFVFPSIAPNQAQPLSYQIHPPPPGEEGMEILMWEGIDNMMGAAESEFNTLYSYGVDGFHIAISRGVGWGGAAGPLATRLAWCKDFADNHPQFKITIGITMANNQQNITPFAEWWDDATWTNIIVPGVQTFAHAVADSAIVGIGFDGEDYAGARNGWIWSIGNDPGETQAQVRARVKIRAKLIADTITAITGPVELYEYFLYLHGSFKELQSGDPYDDYVSEDWIDGLTSNSQVKFYHLDAAYYKPDRLDGFPDWPAAYAHDKANYDGNPKLRKSNSFHCPFIWITEGPRSRGPASKYPCSATNTCADRMFPVSDVANQLQNARLRTEAGRFALYDQGYISPPIAYGPYSTDLIAASQ